MLICACFRGMLQVYPASVHATPSIVNKIQLPLQKLLFSATMTHNPEKLEPLKLYKPILFTSAGKESYKMPQGYSDLQGELNFYCCIMVFFVLYADDITINGYRN